MSTLITIPNATALHLPTPQSPALPLASGDLSLVVIPANPPAHPSDTITLSVGSSSFPLLPISPVRKVKAQGEHPTYQFAPIPVGGAAVTAAGAAEGEGSVGQVRIELSDSKSQEQWDATEAATKQFESLLRAYKLWDERLLFVNDDYETGGVATIQKGWGETVAETLVGGASFIASKIQGFTDGKLTGQPGQPILPTTQNAARVTAARNATAQLAVQADHGAEVVGAKVHEAGKTLGRELPDEVAKYAKPTAESDKGEFRKAADEAWNQSTIAAKGAVEALGTVGGSASANAHRAIEHKYGTEADRVAQDVGQTGANLGQAALAATKATSVAVQGANAASGASAARS